MNDEKIIQNTLCRKHSNNWKNKYSENYFLDYHVKFQTKIYKKILSMRVG